MMRKLSLLFLLMTQLFVVLSCSNDAAVSTSVDEGEVVIESGTYVETYSDTDFEAVDWTDDTHSKSADPNFDEVFEDEAVKRLDIVITEERWQSMLDDMTSLYGAFGGSGGPGGGGLAEVDEDPIFVPGDVMYNGKEWYRVGVRFKGNSSLQSSWSSGILKLSFKLDFDEFEDQYPQIDNQRFYGFKKLSLKNNYNDKSMLREKVATDIFRDAGIASSHAAFYTVYVDHGDGPQYFGVYTLVEEVDDTVIDTQFSDNDGNLYKPDGTGASFAEGTFTEDVFVKKTNEDEADFSDIQSVFTALHATNRTTDPETWRANLESVFDTDTFLKYLAVNTVIQNWDTYGRMTHNYYLYNNPDTEKLSWIPWDNNEALQNGNREGSLALDFSDLNHTQWPLIGYLYEDATYRAQYDSYVRDVVDNAFNISSMQFKYATYSALVEPYANLEVSGYSFLSSSSDFQVAISQLNSHVSARATAVNNYLND
ncbi:CotH kinase family protein [Arenibacter palladensis]|uniref:CotH kinase family protein n=1 Tax=Arenibacter palladensis TaxID=237373 RepID=UPI0026E202B4|nr:CotH kinase family protein [Arenibacter palladensis]MDO6601834.1 CotH kinase family protein [Arenibacter palladensis]